MAAIAALVGVVAASGCARAGTPTGGREHAASAPTTYTRPACERPVSPPPPATPVAGVASDHDITSFDGTVIRAHWFPRPGANADQPSPTVLMGPGWSLPGDTNEHAVGVFGALNIASLRGAGFNVLTWDPRGFGQSGGTAMVNSKDFEGRDVQALLDWVAVRPEAQLDAPGDPRVGMVGGSYGGGIQLVTAAIDCRVDALVPVVAWHSLESSLYPAETPKTGWAGILVSVTEARPVDTHTRTAYAAAIERGTIDAEDVEWFRQRGPGELVGNIRVPTLLVQGTVDGLFTLGEGITNYRILRDNGVPVAMLWFCGGHGTCLTEKGDTDRVSTAAIAWLRRYVLDDESVAVPPRFSMVDQRGVEYRADEYPLPTRSPIVATGAGTLDLVAEGGSGPLASEQVPTNRRELLSSLVLPITPARASNAVEVSIDPGGAPALVVGAPELTISYRGSAPPGERPTRVFAQLVDEETGTVIGNQITPIPVVLDGELHTATVPLEVIAFAARPGSRLTLQLVATTVAYAQPRLGGSITFDGIEIRLPVVEI